MCACVCVRGGGGRAEQKSKKQSITSMSSRNPSLTYIALHRIPSLDNKHKVGMHKEEKRRAVEKEPGENRQSIDHQCQCVKKGKGEISGLSGGNVGTCFSIHNSMAFPKTDLHR